MLLLCFSSQHYYWKKFRKKWKWVLSYFTIVQDLDFPEEKLDLINFKKALYLYKLSRNEEGKLILENLIKKTLN